MFGNYYIYDSLSPVADLLKSQLGFSDAQIGLLNTFYSLASIPFLFLGGILIDRLGIRKGILLFTAIAVLGTLVMALGGGFAVMGVGRGLFGMGAEAMIVAITAALAKWFRGKELGLALGLNIAAGRLGSPRVSRCSATSGLCNYGYSSGQIGRHDPTLGGSARLCSRTRSRPSSPTLRAHARMLLKRETLDRIAAGEITLAFRRWKRPTVRAGGRLRTVVGELAIEAVDVVSASSLTARDAKRAGFASLAALREALRGRVGELHRVQLSLAGPDRRVALRAKARLSRAELDQITHRLERMDARSKDGDWTRVVLERIESASGVRAGDLAQEIGLERTAFKQRVRRLKELGLTQSLEVGYRLSPRGRTVLRHLKK